MRVSRRPHLAPPQNVTLLSRNFSAYLTWLPGPGYSQNVTYFVAYQRLSAKVSREEVAFCSLDPQLLCGDMAPSGQDSDSPAIREGRPGARDSMRKGRLAVSLACSFDLSEPQFASSKAPQALGGRHTRGTLSGRAASELRPSVPQDSVEKKPDDAGSRSAHPCSLSEQTRFPATPRGQPVQIPLQPDTSGPYCLSARTIYTFGDPKYSGFSKPTCFFLGAPGANWVFLGLLLLLPLLLVIAIGHVIWRRFTDNPWFQQAKMPWALDFTGHRRPVATFQPCGPESPDALILCPQKELTRRVRPSPSVRTPATVQAGSEEDSAEEEKDDEEDTDDGVSFQPYIEPPPFLGQDHRTPGHSEVGGTWTPPSQAEGSSAADASDRSGASTGGSSPRDEPESCCLTKKGPGQGPGGDGCQEPLLLHEFSQDLSFLEDPLKDNLSSWTSCFSSPGLNLVPGEPPVSLHTLTFCWDSSPEEEEEEEGEEEGGGGERESEIEGDVTGNWRAESLQKAEVRGGTLGHYMAR
ncbi:interleukin-28 receptor subunit [Lynx pardinus]|uniref:Interleukin-28 receptor subunit n=1 Tax=Lynx pardinus TaxID=191816 RepID=A0A485MWK7_LYNPA|nr:interleukin-28 receptor subunit [Lynx pardinus]